MFSSKRSSSQGNVLFLILIAVALFAALSYAVTQSMRAGDGNVGREKGTVDATWLQNYGSSMANGILRMRISKNIPTNDLCFFAPENPIYTNATYQEQNVFSTLGGGVIFERPPSSIVGPLGSRISIVKLDMPNVGTTAGNDTSAEIVLSVGGISRAACTAVNERLGIPTYQLTAISQFADPTADGYPDSCVSGIPFDSSLTPAGFPALAGKSEGCVEDAAFPGQVYYYFRILVEN